MGCCLIVIWTILKVSNNKKLPNSNISLPYIVLVDNAFPLSYNVMKLYPLGNITKWKKIFNYMLSYGREFLQALFGILASWFWIFLRTINLSSTKVTTITLAICML